MSTEISVCGKHVQLVPHIVFRWCLCWLLFASTASALTILSPPEIAGQVFLTPRQDLVGPIGWQFDLIGQLVLANASDVTNKIVMIEAERSDQHEARKYTDKSVGALIAMQLVVPDVYDYSGQPCYTWDGTDTRDVMVPMVIASGYSSRRLLEYMAMYPNVTVHVNSNDQNQWREMLFDTPKILAYSIVCPIVMGSCLIFALYKQISWIKIKGFQYSIAQTVLWFEIIANTIRLVHALGDPLQSRVAFPDYVNHIFYTLSWPFSIISVLLISFYWHELIVKVNVSVSPFLKKLKIVFWVLFGVLLVLEVAMAIVRGLGYPSDILGFIVGAFYIIVVVGTLVFFAYCGIKLYLELKKSNKTISDPESRMKKLRRTTTFIWMSSAALLLWAIVIIVGSLGEIAFAPDGFYAVWFCGNLLVTWLSFSQVFALHVPKPQKSKTGSTKKKNIEMTE